MFKRLAPVLVWATIFPAVTFARPSSGAIPKTRSVRTAVAAVATYPSGFRPGGCEDALALLEPSVDAFAALELKERVRRVHALAETLHDEIAPTVEHQEKIIRRLGELATADFTFLEPYGHELLVIIAHLDSIVAKHAVRTPPIYYALTAFIEKVVNLRHRDTQANHALIAHALVRLAELRVSQLGIVTHPDEHIRQAFEDLERVQREDALGDNEALRIPATLAVLAGLLPAVRNYDRADRRRLVMELLPRLTDVEEGLRQLLASRIAPDAARLANLYDLVNTSIPRASGPDLVDVKSRFASLREQLIAHGPTD